MKYSKAAQSNNFKECRRSVCEYLTYSTRIQQAESSPKLMDRDQTTDIAQYRLRFGFSLLYKTVFHLNCLTAQPSYEGRTAVEGGK
jgi:hypothetical protein